MKGLSKMYLIQCEKYNSRANSDVVRLFCDIDLSCLPPVKSAHDDDCKKNGNILHTADELVVYNSTTHVTDCCGNITPSHRTPSFLASVSDDPTELDFSRNYIGDSGIQAICGVLQTIRRLRKVSFRGCMIEENGVIALCDCFKSHPHIREICLLDNRLFASSGRHLILLLRANPRIYKLEVNTSEMPLRVSIALDKCIKRNYLVAFPSPSVEDGSLKGQCDVRCSEYLDNILDELRCNTKLEAQKDSGVIRPSFRIRDGEPDKVVDPEAVMVAIQERVVHYWYLRLGSYAVQYLAVFGISEHTIAHLSNVEKQYCKSPIEGDGGNGAESHMRPSVLSICPLKLPLEIIKEEINTLNTLYGSNECAAKELADHDDSAHETCTEAISHPQSCTIFRSIVSLRGRTLEAQLYTCNRLLKKIEQDEGDINKRQHHFVQLMQAVYLLRNGIAGFSLHDLVNSVINDDNKIPRYIRDSCSAFEAHLTDEIYHLCEITYEKDRKLSLACDMARYFTTNNKHLFTDKKVEKVEKGDTFSAVLPMLAFFSTAVAGGVSIATESSAEIISKYCKSPNVGYEAAMSMYRFFSGEGDSNDVGSVIRERRKLITEAYRQAPPFLREFLDYLNLSRCYGGSFEVQSTADELSDCSDETITNRCCSSNLKEKDAVAVALTHPFFVWRAPQMSSYQKIQERVRKMEHETASLLTAARSHKVSCIEEALAELKEHTITDGLLKREKAVLNALQRRMVNENDECSEETDLYEALFMVNVNLNSHNSLSQLTRKKLLGYSDGKDIIEVFGQIKDKHDLMTLSKQYSCWKRFRWILSNGGL